ncbi:MAG: alkaline phosphatase family protein [Planctomycetota bacterium]|jgi:hypothetical protein
MRKLTMLSAVIVCALLIITGFNETNAQKVLVNIWDGTEWKKISELFGAGKLPNAESVAQGVDRLFHLTCNTGCFPPPDDCRDGRMKTVTKAQHATMLTGVLADVHGVFSNKCYQLVPDGLTVYEKIEHKDGSIKTAHISSKSKNFGKPIFRNIIEDVDHFIAKDMSPYAAADIAIKLIHAWKKKDFFIVCHFKYPDGKGHEHGVDSKEYRRAIIQCDKQLGRILDQLVSYGILDETKIYILSDHGFGTPKPRGHANAPNTFIISNDEELTKDIYMNQVAGFLLSNFGLEP